TRAQDGLSSLSPFSSRSADALPGSTAQASVMPEASVKGAAAPLAAGSADPGASLPDAASAAACARRAEFAAEALQSIKPASAESNPGLDGRSDSDRASLCTPGRPLNPVTPLLQSIEPAPSVVSVELPSRESAA